MSSMLQYSMCLLCCPATGPCVSLSVMVGEQNTLEQFNALTHSQDSLSQLNNGIHGNIENKILIRSHVDSPSYQKLYLQYVRFISHVVQITDLNSCLLFSFVAFFFQDHLSREDLKVVLSNPYLSFMQNIRFYAVGYLKRVVSPQITFTHFQVIMTYWLSLQKSTNCSNGACTMCVHCNHHTNLCGCFIL